MTKSEAKKKLIKDCVTSGIAIAVVAIFFGVVAEAGLFGGVILGIFCAGLPFGWQWASKVFIALNLYTVLVKAIIAIVLGWIALPITLIIDIVRFCKAEDDIIVG